MKISGNIVDVLNRSVFSGTLIIEDGKIADVVREDAEYENYILPPFIDAHVHVESSMLVPREFARLSSVHGVGAAVSDPHEIANVMGIEGVRYMLENSLKTPFRFYFGAPSCVPATPFETAGGEIAIDDIKELFADERVKYLSEMMNVPGVLFDDAGVMAKLKLAAEKGRKVDGHAPLLVGEKLKKYVGCGITSDHEAIHYKEGEEKISLGMKIQVREGSAAKNFEELYPLIGEYPEMCMLCSDDIHPDHLADGHINLLVKRCVAKGLDVMDVLYSACVTPVKHYGLECGLLQRGDSADFIMVDSLSDFNVMMTVLQGSLVADHGRSMLSSIRVGHINNFRTNQKKLEDFQIKADGEVDIITVEDGQLVTGRTKAEPKTEDGFAVADASKDILKIAVVNRYQDTKPAIGFIKNFGLKEGAIASSVAHDSHNIICVGCDDESICKAANIVIENRGGLSAVSSADTMSLALPVAGIMTDADGYETAENYRKLDAMAKSIGCELSAPYMTLSFMALLVIPSLKISDKGLFDGDSFRFVRTV